MLTRYWFTTDRGPGYGVTAFSQAEAESLLRSCGYPLPSERIVGVTPGIRLAALDKDEVVPNVGPLAVRGVWYPRRNI